MALTEGERLLAILKCEQIITEMNRHTSAVGAASGSRHEMFKKKYEDLKNDLIECNDIDFQKLK